MGSPENKREKRLLRRQLELQREVAAAAAGDSVAANAKAHFLAGVPIGSAKVVSAYWAMRGELDPASLLTALSEAGITCALPVIDNVDVPLRFLSWRPGDSLVDGAFGTRQPKDRFDELVPDVVIVPLLAFDRKGYRLGYGGGYYDRTLAQLRAKGNVLAVGFAYAGQEVAELPREHFDERLDYVVTEKELRAFA